MRRRAVWKRGAGVLIGALLLCTAVLPCAAAQPASSVQQSVIHTEYGDIVVTTTLTVYDSAARASTKSADKIRTVTYQGQTVATVTLSATFGYDGKSAWVEEASASTTPAAAGLMAGK